MIAAVNGIQPDRRMLLFLVLLAVLQFFGLTFGVGNQVEQFSITLRILDPSFSAGDFFLDSAAKPGQPRYYYCLLIAWLSKIAPLEIVIHSLMFINGCVLGLVSFVAARRLLKASVAGAAIAAMLVLLNHGISIGHAGYLTFSNFQPASIAITATLVGIYCLLLERFIAATAIFLFATLIHPTIGAEVGMLGYVVVFATTFITGNRENTWRYVAALIVFLIGIAILWVVPNLGGTGEKLSQPEFFSILMETRAPHHYLGLDFPRRRWLEAILFVIGLIWIAYLSWRKEGELEGPLLLFGFIISVIALCLASLYFVDVAESRLWATAQLFRLVLLVKWAGYLFLGLLFGQWLVSKEAYKIVLAGTVILSSADAISYSLIVALITQFLIEQLLVKKGFRKRIAIFATVPAVLLSLYHHSRYGADDQLLRLFIAFIVLLLLQIRSRQFAGAVVASVLVATVLTVSYIGSLKGMISDNRFRTVLMLNERDDDGARISLLARDIGAPEDLWLVPPNLEQFRFISGRAVVVDFTSVPFADDGLREWQQRLQAMFDYTDKKGFDALNEMKQQHQIKPAIERARIDYGADYAVLNTVTPTEKAVLAQAGNYKIISLAP